MRCSLPLTICTLITCLLWLPVIAEIVPLAPVACTYQQWQDGVSMASLEPLAAALEIRVTRDGETVTAHYGDKTVDFSLEPFRGVGHDSNFTPESAPFREAGATFVPVRPLLEDLGGTLAFTRVGNADVLEATLGASTTPVLLRKCDGFPGAAGGAAELFSLHLDGTELRRLTYTPGEDRLPAFLPDGALVYYEEGKLCLRKADSPAPAWSIDAGWNAPTPPAISPDGTIVFERYLNAGKEETPKITLWRVKADGTGLTALGDGSAPCFSPDGKMLACERDTEDNEHTICLMNPDGGNVHPVGSGRRPRFSPDGRWLVCTELTAPDNPEPSLAVYAVDGVTTKSVNTGVDRIAGGWSPDSRWMLYTDPEAGIGKTSPDQKTSEPITHTPGDHQPLFLPDGNRVLFLRPDPALGTDDLFLFTPDDRRETRLTMALDIEDFSLAPDGTILFTAAPGGRAISRDPVTGFSAEEAVQLGSEKFVTYYLSLTRDWSTAGMSQASSSYGTLRDRLNRRMTAMLPDNLQAQYLRARIAIEDFTDQYAATAFLRNGGGTIFNIFAANANDDMEDMLARVLVSLAHAGRKDPAARAQADKALAALDAAVARFPAKVDFEPYRQDYPASLARLKQLLPGVKKVVAELPDAGAAQAAAFLGGLDAQFNEG